MASYWQKYGLSADPFVDEGLSFESFFPSRWQQQLDLLCHLSRTSNMILLVTGISGIGKSTFMEMLFDKIESKTGVCKVHGSQGVTPDVLQELVIRHIGMPAGGTPESNFQQRFLLQTERMHQAQDEFYLVIDNAHKLPKSSLGLLLDLAEWQSGEAHPLHLVLFGGPQLDAMMAEITAQHLGEAATHTIRIEPFSVEMTRDYILHRMNQAGFGGDLPLSELQINQIHQASNGIPAKINLVARQVLLDNDTKNVKRKPFKAISPGSIKRDEDKFNKSSTVFSFTTLLLVGVICVLAIVLFLLFRVKAVSTEEAQQGIAEQQTASSPIKPENATLLQSSIDSKQQSAEEVTNETSTATNAIQESSQTAATEPAEMTGADSMGEGVAQDQPNYVDSSAPVYSSSPMDEQSDLSSPTVSAAQSSSVEDVSAKEAPPAVVSHDTPTWLPLNAHQAASDNQEAEVAQSSSPAVEPPPAVTQVEPAATTAVAPAIEPQTTTATVKAAVVKATSKPMVKPVPKPVVKPVAVKASSSKHLVSMTADEQSLMAIKSTRFTLQIAGATDFGRLKAFVKEMGLTGQVYFFKTTHAGKPWYVAIYGNYSDQVSAKRAIKDLPVDLLMKQKVWPRSFGSVQQAIKAK